MTTSPHFGVRFFGLLLAGATATILGAGAARVSAGEATAPTDSRITEAIEITKKAISACLMEDENAAFAAYLETLHPQRKATDTAIHDIRRYTWKRFRGKSDGRASCREFVRDGDVSTLEMTRTLPSPIPREIETFKVFYRPISKPERMPAPVIYRSDGKHWLIDTNSL